MEYLELVAPVGAGCCAPLMAAPLVAEHATDLARVFKALGDPVRLRLLSLITSAGDEVRVCDLTGAFDLTAPTISHHLKVLREAGPGGLRAAWYVGLLLAAAGGFAPRVRASGDPGARPETGVGTPGGGSCGEPRDNSGPSGDRAC
jgi:hypothetical protein